MKSRFSFGVAAYILCAAPLAAIEVDGLAATVGDVSILRSDVIDDMRRAGAPASEYERYRNRLIDRQLILKAAATAKVTMQEWVVDNRVKEITDRFFQGDRNKLIASLAESRTTFADFRRRTKEDLIVGAMRWNIVDKMVTATPAEMRAEYKAHPARYGEPGTVDVSVILLKPEQAALKTAVSDELKTNDFAQVALKWSADSHATQGGAWTNVVPAAVFKPAICAEIAKMPVGTLSNWVDLDGWSFLLRKDAERPAQTRTFAAAYEDIERNVKESKGRKAYDAWMDRLKAETYIRIY
ncbi:MAG TPA: hypothetical protein DDY72_00660 [Verrucomicrobia bacterium]|nr:hypothetical protein [Verrucomicrobiota bacterium]